MIIITASSGFLRRMSIRDSTLNEPETGSNAGAAPFWHQKVARTEWSSTLWASMLRFGGSRIRWRSYWSSEHVLISECTESLEIKKCCAWCHTGPPADSVTRPAATQRAAIRPVMAAIVGSMDTEDTAAHYRVHNSRVDIIVDIGPAHMPLVCAAIVASLCQPFAHVVRNCLVTSIHCMATLHLVMM